MNQNDLDILKLFKRLKELGSEIHNKKISVKIELDSLNKDVKQYLKFIGGEEGIDYISIDSTLIDDVLIEKILTLSNLKQKSLF